MRSESGSTSLVALSALAALAFTSIYVFNSTQKTNETRTASEAKNSRIEGQNINQSNFAQLKALLGNRQIAPGVYEPAIYPEDYFATEWDLRKQNFATTTVAATQDAVQLPFVVPKPSHQELRSIFSGQIRQTSAFLKSYQLRITSKNRNAAFPHYIESLDVESTTLVPQKVNEPQKTVKNRARIALEAPVPREISLWIKGPGQTSFSQNFGSANSPLPVGSYTLEVRASGVVYYAELSVGGALHILGLHPESGDVIHGARNIKASNVVIGQHVLDISPGPSAGTPTVSMNETTCQINAGPSIPGTNSKGIDFQVSAFGVNGIEAVAIRQTGVLFIETPPLIESQGGKLACADKCIAPRLWSAPHVMDPPIWAPMLDDGIRQQGDPSLRFDNQNEESQQLHKAGVSGIVCVNYDLVAQMIRETNQMLPSQVLNTQGASAFVEKVRDLMPYRQIYAFVAPSCQKQLIGQRNSCGCFASDTPILMADGTSRPIRDLKPGDFVWNPMTKSPQAIAQVVAGPESKPMIEVISSNGRVVVTDEHPFMTPVGLVQAKDLRVGFKLMVEKVEITVLDIKEVPPTDPLPIVWNLELAGSDADEEHFVIAAGIMTGDLYLQRKLQLRRATP